MSMHRLEPEMQSVHYTNAVHSVLQSKLQNALAVAVLLEQFNQNKPKISTTEEASKVLFKQF